MRRRKVLPLLAAPLAWLGCNGLLGIDDATFVPLPDGSTNVPDSAVVPIGPIRPSKMTLRLPANETRTIDVVIVPDLDAGIFGASDLAAVPGDTLFTASVAKVDTDRFTVTVVGPATVDRPIDSSLRLEGKDSSGATQMMQTVRVLLGPPGGLDTTFGTSGSAVVTGVHGAGTAESFPLALLAATPVVGDGDGRIHLFENEGVSPRAVQVAATATGCTVDAVTAATTTPPVVSFGTSCPGTPRGGSIGYFLPATTDAAPTTTPIGAPVLGVALTRESLLNVLAGGPGNYLLSVAGNNGPAMAGATASSLFSTGDGVFAVGGRATLDGGAELVLEYTPVNEAGGRLTPSPRIYTRLQPDALGTDNTAVGTKLAMGRVAASWSIKSAGRDSVFLYILDVDGSAIATRQLEAYTARLAGDARGRVVVAADVTTLEGMVLRRVLADGTDDLAFPETKAGCSFPAVAVDPDGMIVVTCEVDHPERTPRSSDLIVRRYWP